eukprot:TRINITY_DN19255_c1_g1_i1.p2 TRINITY_DN19255_c1_g1~~TRINITY_DN19255_c1_g1_i1.p2  ORF type:complete len:141 (+),score=3.35 TRINITY_DN19255_c1_g1_i1:172-594(+)
MRTRQNSRSGKGTEFAVSSLAFGLQTSRINKSKRLENQNYAFGLPQESNSSIQVQFSTRGINYLQNIQREWTEEQLLHENLSRQKGVRQRSLVKKQQLQTLQDIQDRTRNIKIKVNQFQKEVRNLQKEILILEDLIQQAD